MSPPEPQDLRAVMDIATVLHNTLWLAGMVTDYKVLTRFQKFFFDKISV